MGWLHDAMVEFDQMWFIFQHSLPCGPHFYSIRIAAPEFQWYRISHPDPRKSPQLQILPHHRFDTIYFPAKCLFCVYVREQKIVIWCQIRGIWRVINQFKATITHTSHCNQQVCRSIVLVKRDSLHRFSRPFTKLSLVLLLKVLNYLSSVDLSGRTQRS